MRKSKVSERDLMKSSEVLELARVLVPTDVKKVRSGPFRTGDQVKILEGVSLNAAHVHALQHMPAGTEMRVSGKTDKGKIIVHY